MLRPPSLGAGGVSVELKASELATMLEGIDLKSIKRTKRLRLDKLTGPSGVEGATGPKRA